MVGVIAEQCILDIRARYNNLKKEFNIFFFFIEHLKSSKTKKKNFFIKKENKKKLIKLVPFIFIHSVAALLSLCMTVPYLVSVAKVNVFRLRGDL